jgi:hypothetical protein
MRQRAGGHATIVVSDIYNKALSQWGPHLHPCSPTAISCRCQGNRDPELWLRTNRTVSKQPNKPSASPLPDCNFVLFSQVDSPDFLHISSSAVAALVQHRSDAEPLFSLAVDFVAQRAFFALLSKQVAAAAVVAAVAAAPTTGTLNSSTSDSEPHLHSVVV